MQATMGGLVAYAPLAQPSSRRFAHDIALLMIICGIPSYKRAVSRSIICGRPGTQKSWTTAHLLTVAPCQAATLLD